MSDVCEDKEVEEVSFVFLIRLCARSWLGRHPAKIEITGSSWGSSHQTKIFFFVQKS
jgi:hypothetical protein